MRILKTITTAIVLFVAFSFRVSTTSAPTEKFTKEIQTAPHKICGPIGMTDEDQF